MPSKFTQLKIKGMKTDNKKTQQIRIIMRQSLRGLMFVGFMSLKTSSLLHDTLSFPCDCYICPFTGSLAGESSFQRKVTVSQTQLQLSKLLSNLIIILHQITKKTNNTKHMAIKVMAKKTTTNSFHCHFLIYHRQCHRFQHYVSVLNVLMLGNLY